MCFSNKRFSKRSPDFFETTGSSGTSPETVNKKIVKKKQIRDTKKDLYNGK